MITIRGTFLTIAALRRTAMAELLLLLSLQLAPAFDLFSDNIAFAAGADRLLPAAAAEGTAAAYSREGTPEGSALRLENSGGDAAPPPYRPGIVTVAVTILPATTDDDEPVFPHRGNDILHISPKHSPPVRS
ncbi:MAG TPA: hypothetical protein PLV42_04780 [bacterium]|nr:hypothetical protein [bacterium]